MRPSINFPGFLCSNTATKTRARCVFQLREVFSDRMASVRAIKQVAPREQLRAVFYRRVNQEIPVRVIFRPASTPQI
jgi:hypothetical protein